MKTGLIAVGLAGVVVVVGLGLAFFYQPDAALVEPKPTHSGSEEPSKFVHVDELAEDPNAYQGELVLRAVVAQRNDAQGVVSVIDSREFESCGQLRCAANYLPVEITGTLPEPKTLLLITGEVARSERGLVFRAKEVREAQ